MAKTITLSLKKDLIFEAVKAESFETGRIDKSDDPVKNAQTGALEQAGGEQHQERMLLRYLKQAVGKFEALMTDFVEPNTGSITDTLTAANADFNIVIIVSDRFQNGLATPISSLCEDYLVSQMLFAWWRSRKPEFAKQYILQGEDDIEHIRLCFSKKAPEASSSEYTDVNGNVTNN